MKKLSPARSIFHLRSDLPEYNKYPRLGYHLFLGIVIFCLTFSGCNDDKERDPDPSPATPQFDTSLLTLTVWGPDNDLEIWSSIFEPEGTYVSFHKIYQYLYNGRWSIDGSGALIIGGVRYKIKILNTSTLVVENWNSFSSLKYIALTATKAITVGVTDLSTSTARLHGSVRTCSLTEVSFEYGNSNLYGSTVLAEASPVEGPANKIVHATISRLNPETVYHYRIKAVNSSGTYYGQDQTLRTFNSSILNDADNNAYNTVTIGSQVWMAENLKTTKFKDGSQIPLVRDSVAWTRLSTPAYSWNKNDSLANKNVYGAYYNWYAVNTGMLCPTGWHVPDDRDWTILIDYLGEYAGGKLAEGGYEMTYPNCYAYPDGDPEPSNESGFSAWITNMRTAEASFTTDTLFFQCDLWSNSEADSGTANHVTMSNGHIFLPSDDKKYGLAVRCLKN